MPTIRKTWPYGTTRRGVVCIANWRPKGIPDNIQSGQLVKDELNEMHICIGKESADLTAAAGDTGTPDIYQGRPDRRLLEVYQGREMKQITQDEFLAEAERRFGSKARAWKFVCPACGTIQSVQQYFDAGLSSEQVHGVVGYSCIGRFTGQGDAGITAHQRGLSWDKGCNWTLGGLLHIHTLEVLIDGRPRPTFELAPETTTTPKTK